jgi:hypothetical protein
MRRPSYLLLFAIFFFSCTQRENKNQPPVSTSLAPQTVKKISINEVGWVEFVKSYASIDWRLSKKERDRETEEIDKLNPGNRNSADSLLKKRFEKLGFVKGDDLLLGKFKYSDNPDTSITSPAGRKIKIHIEKDTISGRNSKIFAHSETDSAELKITIYWELEYALLDVIPGGNKELVILTEHYVANAYLYYFFVYEIKTVQ